MLNHDGTSHIGTNHLHIHITSHIPACKLLKERIASARVLKPEDQAQDEVRFGATVKFKNKTAKAVQTITIVGVDEANVSKGKIAFTTPIAKALAGSKKDETVDFKLGNEIRKLEILEISY